ncbi:MAG: hypothetical protein R3C17_18210 [Planctomycetaceae bacterium]
MSKCDIKIEFDRDDRTYSGGETVTGRVFMRVNESVRSKGITLTHQWRTHGRGNVTFGPKEKIELEAARSYSPGEEYEFPFSLATATHPLTYHGTMINVDHYVSIQVDVPWSFNPKAEEEYVLVAGNPPEHFVGSRKEVIVAKSPTGTSSIIGKVILAIIFGVLLVTVSIFAFFLLPIILLIAGFFWFRKKALESRLGEVQFSIPHVIVAPGERWTASLQFQPRKQFRINSIGLTLLGKEAATSGSGTNSTTHTHKILEQKFVGRANDILTAGESVREEFTFDFPDTDAFSLELSDNKIQWTAAVRIDIPAFPDWSRTQALQVVPSAFLKNLNDASSSPADIHADQYTSNVPAPGSGSATQNRSHQPPDTNQLHDDDFATTGSTDSSAADLLELVAELSAAPRHGNERPDIVSRASGAFFDAVVIVDRVISSMGTLNSDPRYEYGKSITGSLKGTDQAIQIITPESLNETIDDLRRGDEWPVRIKLLNWDGLYNRINARQAEL